MIIHSTPMSEIHGDQWEIEEKVNFMTDRQRMEKSNKIFSDAKDS